MRKIIFFLIAGLGLTLFWGGQATVKAESDSITVFCGSANKPAMEEIAAKFKQEKNIDVNMIFGGSGTLLSQIELSKKGEIYLPGSPDYIVIAERKKLIIENSARIVAYLVPAIITPAGNPANIHSLKDLARPGVRVGIGNPETVCLGLYGIELLEKNSLLAPVLKNVVTFGGSCSKTANLAAMNQVDAILGWRVFHCWNPDRMAFVPIDPAQIPRLSHIPISIPIYTKDIKLSEAFIEFVLSPTGKAAYEKYGYLVSLDKAQVFAPQAPVGGEYTLPAAYFDIMKDLRRQK
ncbi:MAG: molybdate ABC transporter substrate-binding protein [Thermodesulfobacteriota bacterium]|nr:molybdate ABC transporter substrate-binding protein [Thermodesulfobacteriota bacterium]